MLKQYLSHALIAGCMMIQGCTNEYTPPAKADGAAIFQTACAECHTPVNEETPEMYFTLHSKNANSNYIEYKIYNGGITKPKFPNIKKQKMRMLTRYVLDHSLIK